MDPELQELISLITGSKLTWAAAFVAVGIPIVYKVIAPLVQMFINKKGGNGKDVSKQIQDVEAYAKKIHTNHMTDMETRINIKIDNLGKRMDKRMDEFGVKQDKDHDMIIGINATK